MRVLSRIIIGGCVAIGASAAIAQSPQSVQSTKTLAPPEVQALRDKYANTIASVQPKLSTRVGKDTASHPAKDWQVWAAFHALLNAQYQKDPQTLRATLEKHSVGGGQLEAIINAGKGFNDDMAGIDNDAKTKIEKNYGVGKSARKNNSSSTSATAGTVSSTPAGKRPYVDIGKDGNLEELLQADGTAAQYENDAKLAVQKHKQALRQALGESSAKKLDDWVTFELAPKVREVDRVTPAADQTGAIAAAASNAHSAGR